MGDNKKIRNYTCLHSGSFRWKQSSVEHRTTRRTFSMSEMETELSPQEITAIVIASLVILAVLIGWAMSKLLSHQEVRVAFNMDDDGHWSHQLSTLFYYPDGKKDKKRK